MKVYHVSTSKHHKYNMPYVLVDTFVKQIDNGLQMSALDFVHCANSILEYPVSVSSEIQKDSFLLGQQDMGNDLIMLERIASREDNFWSVYHQLLNEYFCHKAGIPNICSSLSKLPSTIRHLL